MLSKIRNNFITGVAIIFPLAITIAIVRYLVIKINNLILNPLLALLRIHPYLMRHSVYIGKTVVFIIVIFLILLIGWAANIIFLRRMFSFGERIFLKVPMIGKIYSVTKEIGSAFLGQDKAFFQKVVLIEYPRKGLYSIGFQTGAGRVKINSAVDKELIGIFVPTTPNPTSGVFLMVPKDEIKFLDISVEEGLKIVVSSGTIAPPSVK
ncbi:MAG: hypothetical protein A2Z72_07085 [Omnitrophica bacterium RBG_13_46_9]|nr:MAG: hypothetical protein A2Z72_07085 [Omnitrophica bacterium RBG_13_46_9]